MTNKDISVPREISVILESLEDSDLGKLFRRFYVALESIADLDDDSIYQAWSIAEEALAPLAFETGRGLNYPRQYPPKDPQ